MFLQPSKACSSLMRFGRKTIIIALVLLCFLVIGILKSKDFTPIEITSPYLTIINQTGFPVSIGKQSIEAEGKGTNATVEYIEEKSDTTLKKEHTILMPDNPPISVVYLGNRPFMIPGWQRLFRSKMRTAPIETVLTMNEEEGKVPRLVYEETPRWHSVHLVDWTAPYVLVSRHIPDKNWLMVFTQGYNPMMLSMARKSPNVSKIMHCLIDKKKYPLVRNLQIIKDAVVCDLNVKEKGQPLPAIGSSVSIVNALGHHIYSFAKFMPFKTRPTRSPQYNVCAYTQIKDEARYIRDWVEYHRRVGVDHFFISDNNSSDNINQMLKHDPNVEILYWPWKKSQVQAWIYGRIALEPLCKWIMFIDVDQYLRVSHPEIKYTVPSEKGGKDGIVYLYSVSNQLKLIEKEKPSIGQISLANKLYGSSGYVRTPNIRVPEAYVYYRIMGKSYQTTQHVIVRPSRVNYSTYIHHFGLAKGYSEVFLSPDIMHWNHYSIRSWEDYMQKYKGRNGLVRDWKTPSQLDPNNPPGFWEGFKGDIRDTTFRRVYRHILSDTSLPPLVKIIPYETEVSCG